MFKKFPIFWSTMIIFSKNITYHHLLGGSLMTLSYIKLFNSCKEVFKKLLELSHLSLIKLLNLIKLLQEHFLPLLSIIVIDQQRGFGLYNRALKVFPHALVQSAYSLQLYIFSNFCLSPAHYHTSNLIFLGQRSPLDRISIPVKDSRQPSLFYFQIWMRDERVVLERSAGSGQ